jgi:hypothetical protein
MQKGPTEVSPLLAQQVFQAMRRRRASAPIKPRPASSMA